MTGISRSSSLNKKRSPKICCLSKIVVVPKVSLLLSQAARPFVRLSPVGTVPADPSGMLSQPISVLPLALPEQGISESTGQSHLSFAELQGKGTLSQCGVVVQGIIILLPDVIVLVHDHTKI